MLSTHLEASDSNGEETLRQNFDPSSPTRIVASPPRSSSSGEAAISTSVGSALIANLRMKLVMVHGLQ